MSKEYFHKKKSLGQHFLRTASYLKAVAETAEIVKGETVLEIGPGEGALTEELLARGAQVIAVEKDTRLIPLLRERFAGQALHIVEGDALLFGPHDYGLMTHDYKVVGNIPYYITGALFKKFLSGPVQPSLLVFLVQKEVAERIARSKKESILSLSIKAYGDVKYIKTVPRGAFSPAPKVDSAILCVKNISRKNFSNAAHEEMFFTLVRAGFSQKRKLLKRNIENVLGEKTIPSMHEAGIAETARAEDVSLSKWVALSKILN